MSTGIGGWAVGSTYHQMWDVVLTFFFVNLTVSRLNHACRPNSEYFFDDRTLSQKVFTARDIDPGEELTVTYSE